MTSLPAVSNKSDQKYPNHSLNSPQSAICQICQHRNITIELKLLQNDKLSYKKMLKDKLNIQNLECDFEVTFREIDKISKIRCYLSTKYNNFFEKKYFILFLPFKSRNIKEIVYKRAARRLLNRQFLLFQGSSNKLLIYYKISYFPQFYQLNTGQSLHS